VQVRGLGLAIAIVILFCAVMAGTMVRGQALYQPEPRMVDFGDADWLQYPGGSDVIYLRKAVIVAETPTRAWLRVAAIDEFEVYLNGTRIGREEAVGAWPSGVYDVSRKLVAGRNVVAIRALSTTYGTTGRAIAVLEWTGQGNHEIVRSDSTWRVERRQRFSALGTKAWSDRDTFDADWRRAEILTEFAPAPIQPQLPLAAVGREPRGNWIWHSDRLTSSGSFVRILTVDGPRVERAWMGVATHGLYVVSINGILIGPAPGSERRMEVFDIGPYLHRGDNEIHVQVTGATRPMRLAVRGEVQSRRGDIDFSSDDRWQASPLGEPTLQLGAIVVASPELVTSNHTAHGLRLDRVAVHLETFIAVLALVFGIGIAHVTAIGPKVALARRWLGFSQPLALSVVLIGLLQLVDWDPRFSLAWVYRFWLPVAVLGIIGGWLFLLQLDRLRVVAANARGQRA